MQSLCGGRDSCFINRFYTNIQYREAWEMIKMTWAHWFQGTTNKTMLNKYD